jgi:hypothetical protein
MLKSVIIIVALIAVTGCANPASSRVGAPPIGQALWEGTWGSDEYLLINGQVAVLLPEPLSSISDTVDVAGAIHYGALTLYRPGRTFDITFTAKPPTRESITGSNENAPLVAPGFRLLLFSKGAPGPSRQVIEYDGTVSAEGTIEGAYRSSNPYDVGHFRLRRRPAG